MTTPDRFSLLRNVQLFRGCDDRLIAALARRSDIRALRSEEVLISPDDPPRGLGVVHAGAIDLTDDGVLVARCKAGSVVAELGVVSDAPHSVCATAATDAVLVWLSRREFFNVVVHRPDLSAAVFAALTDDLLDLRHCDGAHYRLH